jgi:hypothetical protein
MVRPLVPLLLAGCADPPGREAARPPTQTEDADVTDSEAPLELAAVVADHVPVSVELTRSNHLAVEIASPIGPLRMFVDTGASLTVLSEQAGDALGVSDVAQYTAIDDLSPYGPGKSRIVAALQSATLPGFRRPLRCPVAPSA